MYKLIPLILALIGLGGGAGAGLYLRPGSVAAAEPEHVEMTPEEQPDYVKMSNQFIIPILREGRVASMMILSLSVETHHGGTEDIYAKEPKLRDAFLQVMFDHANAGGFEGEFTDASKLIVLRKALKEAAQKAVGDLVADVLIADIARQEG